MIVLRAEQDVKEDILETCRKQCEEAINSAPAAHGKSVEQREESLNFEDGIDLSPAKGLVRRQAETFMEWQKGSKQI